MRLRFGESLSDVTPPSESPTSNTGALCIMSKAYDGCIIAYDAISHAPCIKAHVRTLGLLHDLLFTELLVLVRVKVVDVHLRQRREGACSRVYSRGRTADADWNTLNKWHLLTLTHARERQRESVCMG